MYKFILSTLVLVVTCAKAQDKRKLDSLDKEVIAQIIAPAQRAATEAGEEPDWTALSEDIKQKYSATQADRAITKAQIYYYYGKDWAQFSTAIVHYTEAYEDKEDLKLMNKNAQFILQYSISNQELQAALKWIKHAVDKEPTNPTYKATYDGIAAKTMKN